MSDSSNMISLTPCNSTSIMVGNGDVLPVTHIGQAFFLHSNNRLTINNVLIYNKMVKNIVSIRQFTLDNFVSITFDLFCFTMKDYNIWDIGAFIQGWDSVCNLYHILLLCLLPLWLPLFMLLLPYQLGIIISDIPTHMCCSFYILIDLFPAQLISFTHVMFEKLGSIVSYLFCLLQLRF